MNPSEATWSIPRNPDWAIYDGKDTHNVLVGKKKLTIETLHIFGRKVCINFITFFNLMKNF